MDLITTTSDLAAACSRLAQHKVITVDTEFLRETTYYPLLCVVQMASADEAVVIDTLAPGIDLKPFFELMGNEAVLKVFHAARQDIEIVWHQSGTIPHPIFDTQVAAMVLGYGDSIAYDQLVERVTGHRPDKTHRFTDWSRRPLTPEQMHYAVSDVTHLRDVFAALDADLKKRGRSDWVSEEMEVLTSPKTYDFHPERAWERLKTRVRKPKELAVLMEVAAWREQEAQSRDVPRSRVLKDDAVGDIATHAPTSLERLASLRSLPKGFDRSKWGTDIVAAVQRGLARDPHTPAEDRKAARQFERGCDRRAAESAAADDVGTPCRRQQGHRHRRRSRPDRRRRPSRRRRLARLAPRIVRRSRDCAETRPAGARDRKRPRRQGRPGLAARGFHAARRSGAMLIGGQTSWQERGSASRRLSAATHRLAGLPLQLQPQRALMRLDQVAEFGVVVDVEPRGIGQA